MPELTPPVLVISGSLADAARTSIAAARTAGLSIFPIPDRSATVSFWIESIQHALAASGVAFAVVDRALDTDPDAGKRFTAAFARLAQALFATGAFRHLILEGGATAAAVLHALGVPWLLTIGEWSPGVVALAGHGLAVTLKPGSYPWPENLTRLLRA